MPAALDPAEQKAWQVRRRLRQKSGGSSTYKTIDLAREVRKLRGLGWSVKRIAETVDKTPQRIYQVLKEYEDREARAFRVASGDYEHLLEWSADAFEEFFVKFSGFSSMPRHVRPWIESFLKHRNVMLNVPPRHAKSTYFMVWIPIWLICRDRNVQVLLVSKTHEFAQNWALEIAGQLEHNDELIKAFGAFKAEKEGDQKWKPNSGTFTVLGRTKTVRGAQFTVESRGMNGQVLGREADFVFVDDPTDQEQAESEVARIRELKHLREQVFTRAEPQGDKPGGRIAVVGQRVHLFDLYGELGKQEWEVGPLKGEKLWHVEKYPAVLDWEKQHVLWPERHSWDELMLTYARVGGHAPFSCLFQQEPMPEGTALVRMEWIEACRDRDRPARVGHRIEHAQDQFVPIVRVVSIDPSPTKFNGIIVGDLAYDREHFAFAVTEVIRMKAGIRDLKAEVDRIISSVKPDYLIFEESGFLTWFRDDPWFVELKDRVRFVPHHTGVNKNTREYGVQSLGGDFEFARISLPYGDEEGRRMSDLLSNEALTWYEGVKDGFDLLMALWFVKFNFKKLSPVHLMPTHVRGSTDGGWSWMRKIKDRKNVQDENYRNWQKAKAARQEEQRKVSVG